MSNAAQEPRRWTLLVGRYEVYVVTGPPLVPADGSERVPVIEASAYDALLAERDALKAELDDQREAYRKTIEDECATDEKHCACVPFLRSEVKRISDECDEGRCPSAEHERLAAAALREKAERLHGALVTFNWNGDDICRVCWGWRTHKETHHAPGCPAAPDFLTTSATESRGAKGGEQC